MTVRDGNSVREGSWEVEGLTDGKEVMEGLTERDGSWEKVGVTDGSGRERIEGWLETDSHSDTEG